MRRDAIVVGADGCRAGWVAVQIQPDGLWNVAVYTDITALWKESAHARLILVDIPIGLPGQTITSRACDIEARCLLGWPRASSIFSPPSRAVLNAASYTTACRWNQKAIGKKLSQQSYNLIPKIKQVDDLLQIDSHARHKFREIHPEICFWALNNRRPMKHNKKTDRGFQERLRVLNRVYSKSRVIIEEGLMKFRRVNVARDDIVDALVAAVTAFVPGNLSTLPDFVEMDACGLPMEMVCRFPLR